MLQFDSRGFVDVEALGALVRPDDHTHVSIMAVNNEIGVLANPMRAISELAANKPTISFHVDAVQAHSLRFDLKNI